MHIPTLQTLILHFGYRTPPKNHSTTVLQHSATQSNSSCCSDDPLQIINHKSVVKQVLNTPTKSITQTISDNLSTARKPIDSCHRPGTPKLRLLGLHVLLMLELQLLHLLCHWPAVTAGVTKKHGNGKSFRQRILFDPFGSFWLFNSHFSVIQLSLDKF